jgi:signal peptidase I
MSYFTDARATSTPTSETVAVGPAKKKSGISARGAIEWGVILTVAVLGAFLIRTFLIQAFYIPSPSMTPTLVKNDRVLVNKTSYRLHPVHRGDIVVFVAAPGSEVDPSIKDLIKRVIGLPGETIESHGGQILINGRALIEPYLLNTSGSQGPDVPRQVIPPHHYFVMGDNRGNSADSRVFGPIANSQIVGRAFILVWPLGKIHLL